MSLDNPQTTEVRKGCSACGQEFTGEITVCPDDGMVLAPIISEDLVGTVLENKYEILEKIGSGGMGAVYKARHQLMHRVVAIKVVLAQLSANSSTLKRFAQEARASSQLNHPNILTVFDFGISPAGQPYLVMDFLEGVNFARVLEENGRLPVERAIRIFLQVCAALGHAHQRGIVHRDLKPSNIMLTELDGEPDFAKVLDFGIAKVLSTVEGESDNLTRTGEIFGSPLYMSPEQFRGRALDARSDIYSLGCVMYRTLTGICPVTGKDVLECMYKHVNENVPPFQQVVPELNLPERLETIVMKALAKEPEERYATMNELRADLESLSEELKLGSLAPVYLRGLTGSDSAIQIDMRASSEFTRPDDGASASETGPQIAQRQSASSITGDLPAYSDTKDTALPEPGVDESKEGATPSLSSTRNSLDESEEAHSRTISGDVAISGKEAQAVGETGSQSKDEAPRSDAASTLSTRKLQIMGAAVTALILLAGGLFFGMKPTGKAPPPPGSYDYFTSKGLEAYSEGHYSTAESMFKEAMKLAQKLPDGDPKKLESLINTGEASVANDNLKQAKEYLLRAASELKRAHKEKTPDYARVQQDLGELVVAQDDYDAAEPYFQRALELRQSFKGKDRADASDSLQGLATVLVKRGQYQKAAEKLTEAKRIIEQEIGTKNRDYILIVADLARVYSMMGAQAKSKPQLQKKLFDDSRKLYEEAVHLGEKKFGSDHPQLGKIILAYATLCFLEHDFAEAEARFTQALTITRKNSGEDSMAVAEIKAGLAVLLIEEKRYAEAEAYLDEALKTAHKNLPPSSNIVERWQSYKRAAERLRKRSHGKSGHRVL